jgi:hypothetical protein
LQQQLRHALLQPCQSHLSLRLRHAAQTHLLHEVVVRHIAVTLSPVKAILLAVTVQR